MNGSSTQKSRIVGLSQAGNKAASDARLDNFIKNNSNLKNQSTRSSILDTVSNKPQRFSKDNESRRDFILRNTDPQTGRMNSAAQAIFDSYNDGRNDYQRELNQLRTSSPAMKNAYAREFPAANFAMETLPNLIPGGIGMVNRMVTSAKDKINTGVGTLKDKISNIINPKFTDSYANASRKEVNIPIISDRLENQFVNKPELTEKIDTNIEDIKETKQTKKDNINSGTYLAEKFGGDSFGTNRPNTYVDPNQRVPELFSDTTNIIDEATSKINRPNTYVDPNQRVATGIERLNKEPLREINAINPNQEFDDTYGFDSDNFQRALNEQKKSYEKRIAEGDNPPDFLGKPGIQTFLEFAKTLEGPASELRGSTRDQLRKVMLDDYNVDYKDLNTIRFSDPIDRPSYPVLGPKFQQYEDFQDVETMGPVPKISKGVFENLPFYSGPFDFNFSPDRRPETFNTFKNGGIATLANGGYMSSFPNQNLNTESLSASDNIDDRIMKNLQFEKMAPGMMGYRNGGIASLRGN